MTHPGNTRQPLAAALFDLGGVLTESPLEGFARYERHMVLPNGFLRELNSTNPDDNAWARFERREVDEDGFVHHFEREARAHGQAVDARAVLALLEVELRPSMLTALQRLRGAGIPLALLTNNVAPLVRPGPLGVVLDRFDVVVQSSVEGIRKPEPEFYLRALRRLGDPTPSSVVFLDDLGVNLKPARALLGFKELSQHPDLSGVSWQDVDDRDCLGRWSGTSGGKWPSG